MAPLQCIPRSISILLGCRRQELGQLTHQTPPWHLPRSPLKLACRLLVLSGYLSPSCACSYPWATGFSLASFPFFKTKISILLLQFGTKHCERWKISFHLHHMYICKLNIIFSTLWMLPQGCVDPQIPGYGQTNPKSSSCTCQHHLNVEREPSRLS